MLKKILQRLLTFIYKVEVKGLDNYRKAGDRVLIISNHTSFLDPLLLGVFLPDDITFAINTEISERWWLKPFLRLSHVFPMNPTQPLSLRALINHLQGDTKTVIFPEGRITVTGSLMKIYDGTGMVADKSQAAILPVRIHGAEYTHFSRLRNIVRLRLFPKITIQILPHTIVKAEPELRGKSRRKFCGHILAELMSDMIFATSHYQQTIFSALLEARNIHGGKHIVTEDIERQPQTYNNVITRTIAIANALQGMTEEGEHVGVFLPNSTKTLNVVLGLQLHGRIPAMLNFSTGSTGMISACNTAQVKTVLSSRRFIEMGKIHADAKRLEKQVNLVYLEDLVTTISTMDKLTALFQCKTANYWYKHQQFSAQSPAVILFTSGSEGEPKGVVLSHANIIANHNQLKARIAFNAQDVVLNYLPMFHSFGFTVGTLLPILNGMKTFFYPTPLHYSVIPEIAYEIGATIMLGTNTFLAAYGNKAHAYDFYNMRYVIAGAEKLQDNTRQLWSDKFGIRILEGYGATETAPVISVNTIMDFKKDTVGRFMPEMKYKLETIAGIEDAEQLHVYGPNIMQGYLLPDNPGKLVPPESKYGKGWYDTGDIVNVDNEGYISIRGRSKRFAKVSGEMVSLTAVESHATKAWPDAQHASTSILSTRKGEEVILLTTQKGATSKQLSASAEGVHSIGLPKKILVVDAIPVLATGKTNYLEVNKVALDKLQ
ncbi:MAG: AMP-binding protein [Methylococcales symbiont of Hymedesmia sp. n. MRB-2018]|nr:MAG: AMP-binding protein [Methylococcales symbiont of Hymedesmia sp. n. MRB-2018]